MAYQSLYRKYRPQTFADVMGQGHVVRTLQNAIASGRVAHGYLFTGTRGTAKTTIARLLAKALNCESQPHPVTEPCNRCPACLSITAGGSIDVIEMDAASHRGVADIEEVRKSVGYGPMELRYKVFIIDEAHQLSSDAKDAFLKTLEEPPENVVFILATTEPQAIPITIRSRCQQFDFKRGSLAEIASRLRFVLDAEGVTYSPEAINLVARGAEGSYRDSLSLLEQVLAFAPKSITASDVVTVLGTLDTDSLSQVTEAIANRDAGRAFALAGQLLDAGKEARTLLRTMAAHFRDLMLVKVGGPAVASELTPDEVQRLQRESQAFTAPQILKAVDIVNETQGETRWNNQHRLLVELAFLKLMTIGDAAEMPLPVAPIIFSAAPPIDLMGAPIPLPQRVVDPVETEYVAPSSLPIPVAVDPIPLPEEILEVLEEVARESEPEPALDAAYFSDGNASDDEYEPETEPDPVVVVPEVLPAPALTGAALSLDEEPTEPEDTGPGLFDDEPDFRSPATVAAEPTPPPVEETPSRPEPVSTGFGLFDEEEVGAGLPAPDPFRQGAQAEEALETPLDLYDSQPTEPEADPVAEPEVVIYDEPDLFTLQDVYRAWPRFLMDARRISKKTEIMMSSAHPERVYRNTIEIVFPSRFQFDMMNAPKAQEFVRKLFARQLRVERLSVKFVLAETAAPPPRRVVQEKKQDFDPLAAIDALDSEAGPVPEPVYSHATPDFTVPEYRPAVPASSPAINARFATAPRRPESPAPTPKYEAGRPGSRPLEDSYSALPSLPTDHPALQHPLVQDILEIFGGEIVVE